MNAAPIAENAGRTALNDARNSEWNDGRTAKKAVPKDVCSAARRPATVRTAGLIAATVQGRTQRATIARTALRTAARGVLTVWTAGANAGPTG